MSDEGKRGATAGRRPVLFFVALALAGAVVCFALVFSLAAPELLGCHFDCEDEIGLLTVFVAGPLLLGVVGRVAWAAAKPTPGGHARGAADSSGAEAGFKPKSLRAAGWLRFYILGVGSQPTPRGQARDDPDSSGAQAGLNKALSFGGLLSFYFVCFGVIFSLLAPGFCDEEPCPDWSAPLIIAVAASAPAGLAAWNAVARPMRAVACLLACAVLALLWFGLVSNLS